ncbi:MAG: fibronectin type III domain-containing protein [Candidatus Moranbacteria bacterium]|nr:fibronectin type III domain-containing protein [Candidatus Moranbacteria bacterium]
MRKQGTIFRRVVTKKIAVAKWQFNAFGAVFLALGTVLGAYVILSGSIPKIFAWDLSDAWNFSVSGDYATSSGVMVDTTNTEARLSVKNYVSDVDTAALYHFDESSGGTANDSSSAANHATVSSGSFSIGNLNNGLAMNGSTSSATAPDTAETSITGDMTLESWVKFDTGFTDATSRNRQGVVDKGSYQLYFDNETGKAVFEMAPSTSNSWSQVAGADLLATNGREIDRSWDQNSKNLILRQVAVGSDVYVALGSVSTALNGTALGDAEVWKCADCATSPVWSRIGGDGINSSWADGTYQDASSLVSDGTNLYAGLGNNPAGKAEVWRWNGTSWAQVGGDGLNSSWTTAGAYERVTTMVADGTTVYAGLSLSAGDAEVWKCTGCDGGSPAWTKIGGDSTGTGDDSWGNVYEEVSALHITSTRLLVVGLGLTNIDSEVWSCDLAGTCNVTTGWTKRGGDGTGVSPQSWASTTYEEVRSITSSGSTVYVGLGSGAGDAEVWRCATITSCTPTTGWTRVGGDAINSSWANTTYERVWSLLADGTTVYAGLGDTAGDAEVWKCAGCDGGSPVWSQIGGDGTGIPPASWGSQTGASFLYASSLAKIGNQLFVGASSGVGTSGAEMWSCNVSGTCNATTGWSRIAGNYLNKSWGAFNLNSVESLTTIGGKLYAGTGYNTGAATSNGNAQVWEFDGTNWTIIGGQGVNGSWAYGHPSMATPTIRSVTSMTGYNGTLIVGLGGSTAGNAQVWKWNGSTWSQIGGGGTGAGGQSWANAGKLSVPSMMVVGTVLYVGLQGAAGDGELWTCDLLSTCNTTIGWTFLGGDATGAGGQSWNNTMFEGVWSMASRGTNIYMGLGSSAGDAEVWTCNVGAACTRTSGWTKLGGDALNSSWANSVYEEVTALSWYRGELYAGLGASTSDGELWKWNGTNWGSVAIAGDGLNGSWNDGFYERVKAIVSYNGDLIVSLGDNAAGDGEVWKYDTSAWTRIGGDGANSGWSNVVERVNALSVYKGKLYAGTGITANTDAMVWAFGNNARVESTTTNWGTGWHHVAATYDESNLRLYVDGTLESTQSASGFMSDTAHPLVIGGLAGSQRSGGAPAAFTGMLDEIRISSTVRGSFQTTPYSNSRETVQPTTAVRTSGIKNWDDFVASESLNGGAIEYRLSDDGGTTWKYWNGSAWATSSGTSQASDATTIDTNIGTFPVTDDGILWQAVLLGNGNQLVTLNSVTLQSTADTDDPTPPNAIIALDHAAGAPIVTNTWYQHTAPSFEWSGATDTGGSGVAGYFVYFGTSNTAVPETAGIYQLGNTYIGSTDTSGNAIVSGQTYYLRVQSKDNAQNISTTYPAFIYKLDSGVPSNPSGVTAAPAVYSSSPNFTFLWGNGTDVASGIAGYQYQVGTVSGQTDPNPANWSTTTTDQLVDIDDAAYQTGENYFWLRTIDNAGNVSATDIRVSFYFAGDGASAPQLLNASPSTHTVNSFTFDWDPPATYSSSPPGDPSDLTYCYTVNTTPTVDNCTFTAAGITSVGPSALATQAGINTFYVVAKEGSDVGGSISYANYASVFFTANTSAPGIPLNMDIADVSVKNTESWKIALSWEAPSDAGSGVEEYEIYHSDDDGSTYEKVASTSGIAFVHTGLTQDTHYYKVRACDNVHNCGAFSTAVSLYPTGKYTTAAELTAGPTVSLITTKSATITWSTDRTSDTKVEYGKSSGTYFDEEPSNSDQLTEHTIKLLNLSPGTTYHFKAKWTDEDGNTGISAEKSFKTEPAPTITDPKTKNVSLNSAILEFTTKGASKVKIYYGLSSSFGNVKEVSVSTAESTYTTALDDLVDGTKYFYKINTVDTEDEEYEGNTLTFETLPRPKIDNVRIQQARGTAQTVLLVTWETNTETSSIVTYYPEGNPADARDEVDVKLVKGSHRALIKGLVPQTPYTLVVKGRDKIGNEAVSDAQKFTTATDTRAPQVVDANVEGAIVASGSDSQTSEAQLVVSWNTDEPATSQVEFGEGTGTTYAQKTQEDGNLVTNHTVVISKLSPSKVYHLRIISKDKAGNVGNSIDIVSITPKATENALDIVFGSLKSIFGR